MVRQTVLNVLKILEDKHDSYTDPAEFIYDGVKEIKPHLDDIDLDSYIGDFIWCLSSTVNVNCDFDGTLSKCIEMLRSCQKEHDESVCYDCGDKSYDCVSVEIDDGHFNQCNNSGTSDIHGSVCKCDTLKNVSICPSCHIKNIEAENMELKNRLSTISHHTELLKEIFHATDAAHDDYPAVGIDLYNRIESALYPNLK